MQNVARRVSCHLLRLCDLAHVVFLRIKSVSAHIWALKFVPRLATSAKFVCSPPICLTEDLCVHSVTCQSPTCVWNFNRLWPDSLWHGTLWISLQWKKPWGKKKTQLELLCPFLCAGIELLSRMEFRKCVCCHKPDHMRGMHYMMLFVYVLCCMLRGYR